MPTARMPQLSRCRCRAPAWLARPSPHVQRELYDSTGRIQKTVEEEFSDSFAGGKWRTVHRQRPSDSWVCCQSACSYTPLHAFGMPPQQLKGIVCKRDTLLLPVVWPALCRTL